MKSSIIQKLTWILFLSIPACGGGGGAMPQASIPAPTLRISGSVQSSTTASSNVSALVRSAISETGVADMNCHLYTLEGESLGEVITNDDGDFVISVSVDELRSADDTGTTFSEDIVLACDNGIDLYTSVDVTEGTTTEVDIGDANTDTTLAAFDIGGTIDGWDGWGEDYSVDVPTVDAICFNDVHGSMLDTSDIDGDGLYDEVATIRSLITGFRASGGEPDDLGFDTWKDLIASFLAGTLDADALATMAGMAADSDATLNEDDAVVAYGTSADVVDTLGLILVGTLADGSSGEETCALIDDGTLEPAAVVAPLLSSDDSTTLSEIYGDSDGSDVYFELLKDCSDFDICDDFATQGAAFLGFMKAFDGDFSDIVVDGAFDEDAIGGLARTVGSCGGEDRTDLIYCGQAMRGTVYSYGGFTDFAASADDEDDLFEAWGGYWHFQVEEKDLIPPETDDDDYYTDVKTAVGSEFEGTGSDGLQFCLEEQKLNNQPKESCYANTLYCGDNICDAFESSTAGRCYVDCPSGTNPSTLTHTDNICSSIIGETHQSYPSECPLPDLDLSGSYTDQATNLSETNTPTTPTSCRDGTINTITLSEPTSGSDSYQSSNSIMLKSALFNASMGYLFVDYEPNTLSGCSAHFTKYSVDGGIVTEGSTLCHVEHDTTTGFTAVIVNYRQSDIGSRCDLRLNKN